ncbi:MAG: type II toxin-antitoxin system ParD family antitoxin [Sphingorhabdus sp.]
MDDIRISLPDIEKAFVDEQVAEGDYASASDYVAALIHAEAKAKAQEKLEDLLLEGLEGEDIQWTDANWDELRSRIAKR